MGLLGYDHFAAARPFLLVGGLGGRPFLLAGVVVGILFAVFAAAAGAGCFLRAGGGAAGAADRLRVSLVTFADVGVRTVAVGRPLAPVVAEGGDGHVFGCVLCPVGFKGNLISPQASRKAGRLGDDGIVSRDSLVLHVGRVILADALRGTGIAGFGLRPCIRCRTPGMADGVKENVLGLRGEAIRSRERCRICAGTCIQAGRRLFHSVGHGRNIGDIGIAVFALAGCHAHIAVRNGCPCIARFIPVMVENIASLEGFRSLFAAESTGLVVDRLCRAGGGGFQVLFCDFLCKAVCAQPAVCGAAGRTDCPVLAGGLAADVRGFVYDGIAARIHLPVLLVVSLPLVRLRGTVVGGIEVTILFVAGRTDGFFVAIGRAAGMDMGCTGFQLQLFVRIVFHMVAGVIGGEITRIVRIARSGKCRFFG